jgi:hypothetical protein
VKRSRLGTASFQELDRPVKVDFGVRCEHLRIIGLIANTNKLVKAPAQNLLRFARSELFELGGSHGPSPIGDPLMGL